MNRKRDISETRYRIMQAMLELGRTVPAAQITVRDVCAACQISRKTFYNYFSSKYDLVREIYRDMLAQNRLDLTGLDDETVRARVWETLRSWAGFFEENRTFIVSTYDTEQWNLLENIFFRQALENTIEAVSLYLGVPAEEISPRLRRMIRFYCNGTTGFLLEWVTRENREPVEEIVGTMVDSIPFELLRLRRDRARAPAGEKAPHPDRETGVKEMMRNRGL